MTVSHPPLITQATRPAYESGPTVLRISCNIIREPLPEIARRRIRGRISTGISKKSRSGERATSRTLSTPDDVRLLTAMNIPMRKGKISTDVARPVLAPSMK